MGFEGLVNLFELVILSIMDKAVALKERTVDTRNDSTEELQRPAPGKSWSMTSGTTQH